LIDSVPYYTPEMFDKNLVRNGIYDCTNAIKAAIAAAEDSGFDQNGDPVGKVVFSAGVYRITETGVFSSVSDTYRAGMTFEGCGPLNTIIWLDPSAIATTAWFYNNSSRIGSWNCTFRDMAFHGGTTWRHLAQPTTVFSNKISGFRFAGPDWESAHVFDNCAFTWLDTVMEVAGTNNADTQRFTNCTVVKCRRINFINNPQSMNITWSQCYLTSIFGDFAEWGSGVNGGGDLHFTGGSMIFTPDEFGTTSRIFNMTSGGPTSQNAAININGRFEIRGQGSIIGTHVVGSPLVSFNSCSFLSTATATRKVLSVSDYGNVKFEDCSFANGTGNIEFEVIGSVRRSKQASVKFVDCFLQEFSTKFALLNPNNKGYFHLTGCWEALVDYTTEPNVRQINGIYAGTDPSANTGNRPNESFYTNPLRGGLLPLTTGSDATLQLPALAVITKIYVVLPPNAPSSTTGNYRLFVGSNDKSVIYAQSTTVAQNAGFVLNADVAVRLGTTIASRTVRLWADNGAGGSSSAASVSPIVCNIVYQ
jgi:hypothetical protein